MDTNLVKLLVDAGRGSVDKFSQRDADKVVREALVELCGTTTPDYRVFRKNRNEIFEIVEVALDQLVTSGWSGQTFFDTLCEYRNKNLGDSDSFIVEDNSVLSVAKIAKGVLDLRRQRIDTGTSFTVPVSTYGISVGEDLLRVISGRMDWSKLVAKVVQAYDLKLKEDIYTAWKGALTYLPAKFKESGSFAVANLQNLVNHVKAANAGKEVVIVGTAAALANVYGTADITWSDDMKNEFNKTGKVAYWRGVPLVELPQFHTLNTFDFNLDDTHLYVVTTDNKCIKIVEEGQAIIVENNDGTNTLDLSVSYTAIKNYGISIIFNRMFGVYDLV